MQTRRTIRIPCAALSLILLGVTLTACSSASPDVQPADPEAASVVRKADDLPAPLSHKEPRTVRIDLEAIEVTGRLADGTTYEYWTYGGQVPGPLLRVREGDTVELHFKNSPESANIHSIDLHAVNGPGGGGVATQVAPGQEKSFTFKALNPGVYVYHCATPNIPSHIARGLYGLIVVEPEEGLAPVDREFYVMQGEIYSEGDRDAKGHLAFDFDKLFDEEPNFVVFNGQHSGLTGENSLKAEVGDRVRLWVGNGGPNLISSFHVIGEVFDEVHPQGAVEAIHNVQTTLVPAGGAVWVEFTVDVPGRYTLVDHSISRSMDKGAIAILEVTGPDHPEVFQVPSQSASSPG